MTTNEAIERVLSIARKEVGYHETCDNQTKYAIQYNYDTKLYGFDMNGLAWCSYFVAWVFIQAFGYEVGSAMLYQYSGCSGAACAAAASYFQSHNAFVYSNPNPGDVIFFYYDGGINHTGIVESVSGSRVITIEGNSSDSVSRNNYSISDSKIAGYGRPCWKYCSNITITNQNNEEDKKTECSYNEETQKDISRSFISSLDVDSEFGNLTKECVMSFQSINNLEIDGDVGENTMKKILELIPKVPTRKVIRFGNKGSDVAFIQASLNYISDIENGII